MVKKSRNRYGLLRPFDVEQFAGLLCNSLGQPRRTKSELVSAAQPSPATAGSEFRDEFLLKEVVRKYPGFDLGIDTRRVALESFWDDERLNATTNARLENAHGVTPRVSQVIELAGRKVGQILGKFRWERFEDGLRFGPGATTSRKHDSASAYCKLQGDNHCTPEALPLWEVCLKTRPLWKAELAGGGFTTYLNASDVLLVVPKNALTGRTIGKGPDANVMMQLSLGYCIRAQLYLAGINLQDQSINQQRALAGSLSGGIATVDLKSASNSVTTGLVWRMLGNLPHRFADPRWYALMCQLRTSSVLVGEDRVHTYNLFSCMGNGFTFELESLLFYALSWATCVVLGVEPDVTVYGDDLCVPSSTVDFLTEVLLYCGLRTNLTKTFADPLGGFRESCGKCYLNGFDVTAFYVDKEIRTVGDVFVLANNIVRWSILPSGGRDGRLEVVWEWVVSHLPRRFRTFVGPLSGSDTYLIMDFDEAVSHLRLMKPKGEGARGYSHKSLQRVVLPDPVDDRVAYLAALYNTSYRRFSVGKGVQNVGKSVFIPGRRSIGVGEFIGRNFFIRHEVPTPGRELSRDLPVKFSFQEKQQWSPLSWPWIGPWLRSDEEELRDFLIRSSDIVPLN